MRKSIAEILLELAERIKYPKGEILDCSGADGGSAGRADLALRFDRLPLRVKVSAMVEDWDFQRIFLEVYR